MLAVNSFEIFPKHNKWGFASSPLPWIIGRFTSIFGNKLLDTLDTASVIKVSSNPSASPLPRTRIFLFFCC